MAQLANESYNFGYGYKFSIRRIYDCVILVTFSSVGECSESTKIFLMAKTIGAIIIADKLFSVRPPKNFVLDFKNMQSDNVDCVIIAFALSFENLDDVADYIIELKIAKIIS